MNFDPLPDADNAAVGSHSDFFGDTCRGVSFLYMKVLCGSQESSMLA